MVHNQCIHYTALKGTKKQAAKFNEYEHKLAPNIEHVYSLDIKDM